MLAAGASYPAITLTVNVAATAPASVTNTATRERRRRDQHRPTTPRATPTTITPVPADLTITKTHAGNFTQGQTGATYTLTVEQPRAAAPTQRHGDGERTRCRPG